MENKNWIGCKKLTKREIEEVEKYIKTKLPKDYRKQILKINNGALRMAYYLMPDIGEISYSRNINLSMSATNNAVELYEMLDGGSRRYFPFGSVGNGDYVCFDLKKNNEVVLYVHETQKVYYLCDTFNQFVDKLMEDS
jgi:hypothetical protein